MNKGFYGRLALSNIKNNRKTCVPYMLTCIITIAMYYMILSLSANPGLEDIQGGGIVKTTLGLGCVVTAIFSIIFLFYTNSFLMKRRKKEFGLYNILGMEKRHLARVIAWETFFMFIISLGIGLGIGILGDKLMFLILLKLFSNEVALGFQVQLGVLIPVILFFACIFVLIFCGGLRQIRTANPIELLHGSSTGEREPKTKWIMTLIGLVCLGGGYTIALTTKNPVQAILMFFVAVILVIIGTYCLFMSGSITFLKGLRRNRGFYYKTRHFISVSGMIYRMKQNAVGLANICVLSTMVLVMISSTMSMYIGGKDLLDKRYPRKIIMKTDVDPTGWIEDALREKNIAVENTIQYKYLSYAAYRDGNRFMTGVNKGVGLSMLDSILLITEEDYNRISGTSYELGDHEILVFSDRMEKLGDTIYLADEEYRIKEWLDEFMYNGDISAMVTGTYVIVVPDEDTMERLNQDQREHYGEAASAVSYYYATDPVGDERRTASVIYDALESKCDVRMDDRADGESSFMGMFGSFFFIGIFLGALFIMATILIIYYKQISEGYDDRARFEIMQKVGMSKEEIKKAIHSQVLIVFFLPLITAGIHISFAFPFITRILALFSMTDIALFAYCTVGCFLVFAFFYGVVYAMTAKVYYRIVE